MCCIYIYVLVSFALLPAPLSFVFRFSFVPHDATTRLEHTLRNKHACNRCRSIKCQLTCDNKCIRHIKKTTTIKANVAHAEDQHQLLFHERQKPIRASIGSERLLSVDREQESEMPKREPDIDREGACVCVKEGAHLRESNKSNNCGPKTKIV